MFVLDQQVMTIRVRSTSGDWEVPVTLPISQWLRIPKMHERVMTEIAERCLFQEINDARISKRL